YFNQAEKLDPRNVYVLTQHASNGIFRRRFPEALRKLEQVLDITPDDVDALALKAGIAQAQGDLSRASALLAPLHPSAYDSSAVETQVYQAILERRPALIIPRLKEILANPDPTLGHYLNGFLRFWLGWAQEVGGDHAGAQATWQQARSELEPLLNEQPENHLIMEYLRGRSVFDRAPRPGSGAHGRARPRHRRFAETPLDTVCGPSWKRTAHSSAAPARSDV
ncbi:MAG: hypothetical protein DME94_00235, partial [Verrucomicrobia bacterium]